MTNREIAQEISNRIGNSPIPFDSVYSIALQIYNELGGDETQFDSVYSILLEILPLVEGGINPIKEVNELPEASENKEKFYRLNNGDKDVYVAKLLSSETITTNRLPDEQQIDKAYISEAGGSEYYYKGSYTITCSDGVLNWYLWDSGELKFATSENAVNSTSTTPCIMVDSNSEYWSDVTETGATTTMTMQEVEKYDVVVANGEVIPATYNAPESAQIGNAYLWDGTPDFKYKGEFTFNCSDGDIVVYGWGINNNIRYLTSKPASELYFIGDNDGNFFYRDFAIYWVDNTKIVSISGNQVDYNDTVANLTVDLQEAIYNIYIPQLNAPDSEQVGNAYIYDIYGQHKYYYKGLESIVCTDGTINAPHWVREGTEGTQENNSLFTTPTANSLYKTTYEDGFGYLNYKPNYTGQDNAIFYDTTNNVWKSTLNRESTSQMITNSGSAESLFDSGVNVSTVKYQRTETIEEWDWQPLTDNATNDDIDAMFESPVGGIITLIREQDSAQQASGFVDMWVNTSGETMEYNGQTYYKWVAWYNNPDAAIYEPIAIPNYIMLTNTLDITLPFNRNSSELEYVINYDEINNIFNDGYFKGDYTQKTVQ